MYTVIVLLVGDKKQKQIKMVNFSLFLDYLSTRVLFSSSVTQKNIKK